jgi:hypothetical protein
MSGFGSSPFLKFLELGPVAEAVGMWESRFGLFQAIVENCFEFST